MLFFSKKLIQSKSELNQKACYQPIIHLGLDRSLYSLKITIVSLASPYNTCQEYILYSSNITTRLVLKRRGKIAVMIVLKE